MIDTLGSAQREQHEMISYFSWDAPATKISPYLACQDESVGRVLHTPLRRIRHARGVDLLDQKFE